MELILSLWGGLSNKKFQSVSTRRAQLSVAAKAVRPTDLNHNVKTWVNTDSTRLERSSKVKAPLSPLHLYVAVLLVTVRLVLR